jgi:hypothetical protein
MFQQFPKTLGLFFGQARHHLLSRQPAQAFFGGKPA